MPPIWVHKNYLVLKKRLRERPLRLRKWRSYMRQSTASSGVARSWEWEVGAHKTMTSSVELDETAFSYLIQETGQSFVMATSPPPTFSV
jgi:hypothetical protein